MKTNRRKPFILATLALGLILVMGLGANTFAKYYTALETTNKTATVAKWGFTLEVDAEDLFSSAYSNNTQVAYDATTVDVRGNTDTAVIAPGTSGSMTFTIGYVKTEVDAQVTVSCDITDIDSVASPIEWTLTKGSDVVAEGVTEIETYLNGLTKKVESNTEVAAYTDAATYTLSWEWAFERGANDDEKAANNAVDTTLGKDGDTIGIVFNASVSQVHD